jgi:hypothetical protein
MTKFVRADWNRLLATDQIAEVIFPFNKQRESRITRVDGSVEFSSSDLADDLDKLQRTIIPAQPGFFVVELCNKTDEASSYPIIAWAIDPTAEEYAVRPITVAGMPGAYANAIAGRPDPNCGKNPRPLSAPKTTPTTPTAPTQEFRPVLSRTRHFLLFGHGQTARNA